MAEPVYDSHDEQPVTRPNLRELESGNSTTSPDRGSTPSAGNVSQRDGTGPGSAASRKNSEGAGGSGGEGDAGGDEAGKLNDRVGKGFTEGGKGSGILNKTPASMIAGKLLGNKRKKAAAGGIVAVLVAGVFAWSSTVMSTKVLAITSGLQNTFFASSKEATGDMGDNLFKHYLMQKVMPGMIKNNCTSTRVTRSCADVTDTSSPVSALYMAWRDGNIEGKMADKHGIEIRREGKQFYLHTPQLNERISLGNFDEANTRDFEDRAFAALNRTDVRRELRTALENTTYRERIMFRYSVGGLLERKYGIRRCIMSCNSTATRVVDNTSDAIDLKKQAFKNYLTERVLLPRTDTLGVVMACAINSFDCTDFGEADENGERTNSFQRDVQAKLREHQSRFGQESLEELNQRSEEIKNKGFIQYTVDKVLGETLGKVASKGIPVLGWVDLGANFINGAQNMGPAFTKMAYTVNTTSMVALFSLYRTAADEAKTGDIDTTEFGSITSSLGRQKNTDQGGASAEESPYYAELLGSRSMSTAALLNPTASAASSNYLCDDGEVIPPNKLVCPEETVGNVNGGLSSATQNVSDVANSPMFSGLGTLADFWKNTAGALIRALGGVVGDAASLLIPGWVKDQINDIAGSVIKTFTAYAVPAVVKETSSGGRKFAMMAGGADAAGNDFAHYGIGAKAVSHQAAAEVRDRQLKEDKEEFSKQPLYARLFDTDSQFSVATQLALMMPGDFSGIGESSKNLIRDPLRSMASIFSSLFSGPSASAMIAAGESPTGITQYIYPKDDPVFRQDPELTWQNNDCKNPDNKKNWGNQAVADDQTIMPENRETNPCMLIEESVSGSGGLFNTDLIKEGLPTDTPTDSSGPAASGDSGTVSGDVAELAQKILDLDAQGKIVIGDYSENETSDRGDRSLASLQLQDIAAGKRASGTTRCSFSVPSKITPNADILKFLVDLGGQYKYTINSLFGQCHSAGSNHYNGTAVDFGCPFDTAKADQVGSKYGVSQYAAETCNNDAQHYHYSVGGN